MRIISGKYKGRTIPTIKNADYRPTTAKLKESVFSILQSGLFVNSSVIPGAKVIDVFSGTGGFAFECLSRGASKLVLIDKNKNYLDTANGFAKKLGESQNVYTILSDATKLSEPIDRFDIAFIDPPYYRNYVNPTLKILVKQNWLNEGAIIIIEGEKNLTIDTLNSLILLKERNYSDSKLFILKYEKRKETI